jgi:HSP20 family molecular chaperone IbpA
MNLINYRKNGLAPRRVDLFSEFSRDLDQVFNEVFGAPLLNGRKSKGYPLLDAIRTEGSLTLQYTVPGVRLEDLVVEISKDDQGKLLTVSGRLSSDYRHKESDYQIRELSSQEFRRVVRLPEDVLDEEPEAILKDGLLKLIFKTNLQNEPEPSVKKLKIKSE